MDDVRTYALPESVVVSDVLPAVPVILFAENVMRSAHSGSIEAAMYKINKKII